MKHVYVVTEYEMPTSRIAGVFASRADAETQAEKLAQDKAKLLRIPTYKTIQDNDDVWWEYLHDNTYAITVSTENLQ